MDADALAFALPIGLVITGTVWVATLVVAEVLTMILMEEW